MDAAGNLYITDSVNHRVRKVSGGIINTIAGNGEAGFSGDGGAPTKASLNHPFATVVDAAGNIYIADYENNRVRAVLSGALTYRAEPADLTFSAAAGGAPPGGQSVTLSSAVPGLTFAAQVSAPWLSVRSLGELRLRRFGIGLAPVSWTPTPQASRGRRQGKLPSQTRSEREPSRAVPFRSYRSMVISTSWEMIVRPPRERVNVPT